jgi:hypothetical protein
MRKIAEETDVTPMEWQEHAAKCREIAASLDDETARSVLLEAAEDYAAMAEREQRVRQLNIPAYRPSPSRKLGGYRPRSFS